jgi:hypothetical protein
VGDPRGTALRAGDRSVFDGVDDAAAVSGRHRRAQPGSDGLLRTNLELESRED